MVRTAVLRIDEIAMTELQRRTTRCAVYTRKSSDEGLDQTFNSLDAQREACENYISSQRHEGWKLIPELYDDGGLSGGSLERPALRRLLEDIAAGKVDLIVVYKIDRLTRSLADFAKLVDQFDAANCSFVSVTQSFNTSTSMGRLTLNVLLSFAQFEREVTAERIRDKISASKKKGYWMGGLLPLGYDKHPDPKLRTLIVNETEAETVREIFKLYDERGCLRQVEQEVIRRDYRSKQRKFRSGKVTGIHPLRRGQINYILRNPVYIGRIRHKQESYNGLHDGIIEADLWEAVQNSLDRKSPRKSRMPSKSGALLTGRIFDETDDALTPSHTQKGNRRYRYYVSSRLLLGGAPDANGWRLPAKSIETAVGNAIIDHLTTMGVRLFEAPSPAIIALANAQLAATKNDDACTLLDRVQVSHGKITIHLSLQAVEAHLKIKLCSLKSEHLMIDLPFKIRRRGVEAKLIFGAATANIDQTLIQAIAHAHVWLEDIKAGSQVREIAEQYNRPASKLLLRLRLAFLSPRIVASILSGQQPTELTLTRLMKMKFSSDWETQWHQLGFAELPDKRHLLP